MPVLIILLNPSPVLLENTLLHTLVHNKYSPARWVSWKLRPKSKTIPCYTSNCFKSSCLLFVDTLSQFECVWFYVTQDLSRNRHGLARIWFIVIRQTKHNSNTVYYFSDPTTVGCCFAISLPSSADSAKINIISTNGKQDILKQPEENIACSRLTVVGDGLKRARKLPRAWNRLRQTRICYIVRLWVIIKALLKNNFPIFAIAFSH